MRFVVSTLQLVQKLEGRASADAPGDGHCDVCTGVACHPNRNMIVSSYTLNSTSACSILHRPSCLHWLELHVDFLSIFSMLCAQCPKLIRPCWQSSASCLHASLMAVEQAQRGGLQLFMPCHLQASSALEKDGTIKLWVDDAANAALDAAAAQAATAAAAGAPTLPSGMPQLPASAAAPAARVANGGVGAAAAAVAAPALQPPPPVVDSAAPMETDTKQ